MEDSQKRSVVITSLIIFVVIEAILLLSLSLSHESNPVDRGSQVVLGVDESSSAVTEEGESTKFLVGIVSLADDLNGRETIRGKLADTERENGKRVCAIEVLKVQKANRRIRGCSIIYAFLIESNANHRAAKDFEAGDIFFNEERGSLVSAWFQYASRVLQDVRIDYVGKAEKFVDLSALLSAVDNGDIPPFPSLGSSTTPAIYGGKPRGYMECVLRGVLSEEKCRQVQGYLYMTERFYFLSYDLVEHVASDEVTKLPFRSIGDEDFDLSMKVLYFPRPVKIVNFETPW